MTYRSASVIIVDDDARACELIEDVLASLPLKCLSVNVGEDAREHLLTGDYDVAVMNLGAKAVAGAKLLKFISDNQISTRVICATDQPASDLGQGGGPAEAWAFLERPMDMSLLVDAVCLAAGVSRSSSDRPKQIAPTDSPAEPSLPGNLIAYRAALAGGELFVPDGRFKQVLLEFAGAMVRAVEAKDPYTRRHSDHVAFYAEHFSHRVGLTPRHRDSIRMAALLHDIGKIAVPDVVLTKPGKLSQKEFELIRRHPDVGSAILANISLMKTEANLVRCHHENWDGSGYPDGLRGGEIPLGARILNIADSMDAMLMHRTYKSAYPPEKMLEEIERCAGTQFDPELALMAVGFWRDNQAKLILPPLAAKTESA